MPRIFLVALVLLGLVLGFLVGASQSPLASAVLPVLTIFVGGLAAVSGGTGSLSAIGLRRAGFVTIFLIAGFVGGLPIGLAARIGAAEYVWVGPFAVDWGGGDPSLSVADLDTRTAMFEIAGHLAQLGVGEQTIRRHMAELASLGLRVDMTALSQPRLKVSGDVLRARRFCNRDGATGKKLVHEVDVAAVSAIYTTLGNFFEKKPAECDQLCRAAFVARALHFVDQGRLIDEAVNQCAVLASDAGIALEVLGLIEAEYGNLWLHREALRDAAAKFGEVWNGGARDPRSDSDVAVPERRGR